MSGQVVRKQGVAYASKGSKDGVQNYKKMFLTVGAEQLKNAGASEGDFCIIDRCTGAFSMKIYDQYKTPGVGSNILYKALFSALFNCGETSNATRVALIPDSDKNAQMARIEKLFENSNHGLLKMVNAAMTAGDRIRDIVANEGDDVVYTITGSPKVTVEVVVRALFQLIIDDTAATPNGVVELLEAWYYAKKSLEGNTSYSDEASLLLTVDTNTAPIQKRIPDGGSDRNDGHAAQTLADLLDAPSNGHKTELYYTHETEANSRILTDTSTIDMNMNLITQKYRPIKITTYILGGLDMRATLNFSLPANTDLHKYSGVSCSVKTERITALNQYPVNINYQKNTLDYQVDKDGALVDNLMVMETALKNNTLPIPSLKGGQLQSDSLLKRLKVNDVKVEDNNYPIRTQIEQAGELQIKTKIYDTRTAPQQSDRAIANPIQGKCYELQMDTGGVKIDTYATVNFKSRIVKEVFDAAGDFHDSEVKEVIVQNSNYKNKSLSSDELVERDQQIGDNGAIITTKAIISEMDEAQSFNASGVDYVKSNTLQNISSDIITTDLYNSAQETTILNAAQDSNGDVVMKVSSYFMINNGHIPAEIPTTQAQQGGQPVGPAPFTTKSKTGAELAGLWNALIPNQREDFVNFIKHCDSGFTEASELTSLTKDTAPPGSDNLNVFNTFAGTKSSENDLVATYNTVRTHVKKIIDNTSIKVSKAAHGADGTIPADNQFTEVSATYSDDDNDNYDGNLLRKTDAVGKYIASKLKIAKAQLGFTGANDTFANTVAIRIKIRGPKNLSAILDGSETIGADDLKDSGNSNIALVSNFYPAAAGRSDITVAYEWNLNSAGGYLSNWSPQDSTSTVSGGNAVTGNVATQRIPVKVTINANFYKSILRANKNAMTGTANLVGQAANTYQSVGKYTYVDIGGTADDIFADIKHNLLVEVKDRSNNDSKSYYRVTVSQNIKDLIGGASDSQIITYLDIADRSVAFWQPLDAGAPDANKYAAALTKTGVDPALLSANKTYTIVTSVNNITNASTGHKTSYMQFNLKTDKTYTDGAYRTDQAISYTANIDYSNSVALQDARSNKYVFGDVNTEGTYANPVAGNVKPTTIVTPFNEVKYVRTSSNQPFIFIEQAMPAVGAVTPTNNNEGKIFISFATVRQGNYNNLMRYKIEVWKADLTMSTQDPQKLATNNELSEFQAPPTNAATHRVCDEVLIYAGTAAQNGDSQTGIANGISKTSGNNDNTGNLTFEISDYIKTQSAANNAFKNKHNTAFYFIKVCAEHPVFTQDDVPTGEFIKGSFTTTAYPVQMYDRNEVALYVQGTEVTENSTAAQITADNLAKLALTVSVIPGSTYGTSHFKVEKNSSMYTSQGQSGYKLRNTNGTGQDHTAASINRESVLLRSLNTYDDTKAFDGGILGGYENSASVGSTISINYQNFTNGTADYKSVSRTRANSYTLDYDGLVTENHYINASVVPVLMFYSTDTAAFTNAVNFKNYVTGNNSPNEISLANNIIIKNGTNFDQAPIVHSNIRQLRNTVNGVSAVIQQYNQSNNAKATIAYVKPDKPVVHLDNVYYDSVTSAPNGKPLSDFISVDGNGNLVTTNTGIAEKASLSTLADLQSKGKLQSSAKFAGLEYSGKTSIPVIYSVSVTVTGQGTGGNSVSTTQQINVSASGNDNTIQISGSTSGLRTSRGRIPRSRIEGVDANKHAITVPDLIVGRAIGMEQTASAQKVLAFNPPNTGDWHNSLTATQKTTMKTLGSDSNVKNTSDSKTARPIAVDMYKVLFKSQTTCDVQTYELANATTLSQDILPSNAEGQTWRSYESFSDKWTAAPLSEADAGDHGAWSLAPRSFESTDAGNWTFKHSGDNTLLSAVGTSYKAEYNNSILTILTGKSVNISYDNNSLANVTPAKKIAGLNQKGVWKAQTGDNGRVPVVQTAGDWQEWVTTAFTLARVVSLNNRLATQVMNTYVEMPQDNAAQTTAKATIGGNTNVNWSIDNWDVNITNNHTATNQSTDRVPMDRSKLDAYQQLAAVEMSTLYKLNTKTENNTYNYLGANKISVKITPRAIDKSFVAQKVHDAKVYNVVFTDAGNIKRSIQFSADTNNPTNPIYREIDVSTVFNPDDTIDRNSNDFQIYANYKVPTGADRDALTTNNLSRALLGANQGQLPYASVGVVGAGNTLRVRKAIMTASNPGKIEVNVNDTSLGESGRSGDANRVARVVYLDSNDNKLTATATAVSVLIKKIKVTFNTGGTSKAGYNHLLSTDSVDFSMTIKKNSGTVVFADRTYARVSDVNTRTKTLNALNTANKFVLFEKNNQNELVPVSGQTTCGGTVSGETHVKEFWVCVKLDTEMQNDPNNTALSKFLNINVSGDVTYSLSLAHANSGSRALVVTNAQAYWAVISNDAILPNWGVSYATNVGNNNLLALTALVSTNNNTASTWAYSNISATLLNSSLKKVVNNSITTGTALENMNASGNHIEYRKLKTHTGNMNSDANAVTLKALSRTGGGVVNSDNESTWTTLTANTSDGDFTSTSESMMVNGVRVSMAFRVNIKWQGVNFKSLELNRSSVITPPNGSHADYQQLRYKRVPTVLSYGTPQVVSMTQVRGENFAQQAGINTGYVDILLLLNGNHIGTGVKGEAGAHTAETATVKPDEGYMIMFGSSGSNSNVLDIGMISGDGTYSNSADSAHMFEVITTNNLKAVAQVGSAGTRMGWQPRNYSNNWWPATKEDFVNYSYYLNDDTSVSTTDLAEIRRQLLSFSPGNGNADAWARNLVDGVYREARMGGWIKFRINLQSYNVGFNLKPGDTTADRIFNLSNSDGAQQFAFKVENKDHLDTDMIISVSVSQAKDTAGVVGSVVSTANWQLGNNFVSVANGSGVTHDPAPRPH